MQRCQKSLLSFCPPTNTKPKYLMELSSFPQCLEGNTAPCEQPGAFQQGKEALRDFALPQCSWKSPQLGERGCREEMLVSSRTSRGLPQAEQCIDRLRGLSACQATALLCLAEAHRSPQARPQHWVCRENMPYGTCGSCGSKQGQCQVWGQDTEAHESQKEFGQCSGEWEGRTDRAEN